MPNIRLSGTIISENDPSRELRADLLSVLFRSGWNIFNSNGDQKITLGNIENKIIESDAFLFTPKPGIEDLFKAISVFVGYQTLDPNLKNKPTLLMNGDSSWDGASKVLDQLHENGTIKQNHHEFLLQVSSVHDVTKILDRALSGSTPDAGREVCYDEKAEEYETEVPAGHAGSVCIFCSASIEDEAYLNDGYELGKKLAEHKLGCVSGAGKSGIMGAVVRGSVDAGGWAAGSNVPHIIEIEGLPEGLSSFWLRPDIYTRMEVMIENSDAFVIMPGGAGTVQELLALLLFRSQDDPLMNGKPIIIYNRPLPQGGGFWDSLVKLLHERGRGDSCIVVDNINAIISSLVPLLENKRLVSV